MPPTRQLPIIPPMRFDGERVPFRYLCLNVYREHNPAKWVVGRVWIDGPGVTVLNPHGTHPERAYCRQDDLMIECWIEEDTCHD
jgi:hypothetical protein